MKKMSLYSILTLILSIFVLTGCSSITPPPKSESHLIGSKLLENPHKFTVRKVTGAPLISEPEIGSAIKRTIKEDLVKHDLLGKNYYLDVYVISYKSAGFDQEARKLGMFHFSSKSYLTIATNVLDENGRTRAIINVIENGQGIRSSSDMINRVSNELVLSIEKLLLKD